MKLYLIIVLAVLFVAVTVGGVLPFLFSAKSTGMVVSGIIILSLLPVLLFRFYRMAMREFEKKETNNES